MVSAPSGTVTFLFTDIEGSTKRWEADPRRMRHALERHDALLRSAIERQGGYVFKTVGDAFCSAFSSPHDALAAALDSQLALTDEPKDPGSEFKAGNDLELRVRMALHTGAVEVREGDYFGQPVNRVARLLATGHGGQVLLSEVTYGLLRDDLPGGAAVTDLSEHRLKDLTRPEHIYQVVVSGLPSEFPPLRTLDARPNNLPLQPTAFIGREHDLQVVSALVRREDVRLVTLTGPGGTGKTRLGLQVAADLLDECPDGVWFVELAPLTDHRLVIPTIAQVLGVTEAAGRPLLDTLQDYLREKRMLLLLDNFEHLPEASPDVDKLAKAAPGVKLLATSRSPLKVYGEREYQVPSLSVPDRQYPPSLEKLSQYEAVRLFIERAQDVKSDFQVTNDNAPAVAEICVRLDGLPLAIELAAARVRIFSPQALLARLDNKLKLLTGGAPTLPSRQQTLRNAIEWSYDLLDEGEKQLFRRMAVFQGGRTLEALEAVCNYDGKLQVDVLDGVGSLVEKSLLQQREGRDGEPRFWMLETIHEYAREKLKGSGETATLSTEHTLYFMRLAEEAEPHLTGAKQQEWLDRLEDEHDNLRAALIWATNGGGTGTRQGATGGNTGAQSSRHDMRHGLGSGTSGDEGGSQAGGVTEAGSEAEAQAQARVKALEAGLRLGGALWRFWHIKGYFREGREQLSRLLEEVGNVANVTGGGRKAREARAKALNGAGNLAQKQGDYASARSLHEESLAMRRELGDKKGIAALLNNLGIGAGEQGDYASARSLHEESLAMRRELGDRWGIANSLYSLGLVAQAQGDYASARSLYEESLAMRRELGDKGGAAMLLNNLGNVAQAQGDYASARSLHEESLAMRRELGDRWGIAYSLGNLGVGASEEGDYTSARRLLEESLAICKELGDKRGIAEGVQYLGIVDHRQGDYTSARRLYEESLAMRKELGDKGGIASLRGNLGSLAREQADYASAVSQYQESLAVCKEHGDKHGIASWVTGIGGAVVEQGVHEVRAGERARGERVESGVRLLGAAAGLLAAIGAVLDAVDRLPYERAITLAHTLLGEEAFERAWQEGRAMSMEEAIEYALKEG